MLPEQFTIKFDQKTATQAGIGLGLMAGILIAAGIVLGMYLVSLIFEK